MLNIVANQEKLVERANKLAPKSASTAVYRSSPTQCNAANAASGALSKTFSSALAAPVVKLLSLPDNRMDGMELLDVVKIVEAEIEHQQPVMVLTQHAGDVNVDHGIIHDAVITACRPQPGHSVKTLLFFEVPSSTEWRPAASGKQFAPNYFYDVTAFLEKKLAALNAYAPEMRAFPHPRSIEAVEHPARWRGATIGCAAAEAFMLGRSIV